MAFAALNYALNGDGNGIWLVLLHDAGHTILGIPWWVWLAGGLVLTAFAVAAAPELLLFAPEALEAAEAGEAAMDASLAEQGVSEAVARQIAQGSAIQEEALGEAVANAIREGNYAANRAFIDSYNASLAAQVVLGRIAAVVGPAAIGLGLAKNPDTASAITDQLKQVGSAVQEVGTNVGDILGSSGADPAPNNSGNTGDPG